MLFAFAVSAANAEPVGVHFMSQRGSAQAGTDTMHDSFSAISEVTQSSFFEAAVMADHTASSNPKRESIDQLQIAPRTGKIASLESSVVASRREANGSIVNQLDAIGSIPNISIPNGAASSSSAYIAPGSSSNSAPNVAINDSNANAAAPDTAAQLIEDATAAVVGGTDASTSGPSTTSADVTSADLSNAVTTDATPASATPEPSTMAMVGSLLVGVGLIRIKRDKRS
jgi:hypothetical protein